MPIIIKPKVPGSGVVVVVNVPVVPFENDEICKSNVLPLAQVNLFHVIASPPEMALIEQAVEPEPGPLPWIPVPPPPQVMGPFNKVPTKSKVSEVTSAPVLLVIKRRQLSQSWRCSLS